MRILLTGYSLAIRAGHDPSSRSLARALQARGHSVMICGSDPAQLPRTVEIDWIPVAAEPARLVPPPDIIHACHPHDAFWVLALLPGVPAVLEAGINTFPLPAHPRIYRRLHRRSRPEPPTTPPITPPAGAAAADAPDFDLVLPGDEQSLGAFLEEVYARVAEEHRGRQLNDRAEAEANLEYLRRLFPKILQVDESRAWNWAHIDRFLWRNASQPPDNQAG